MSCSPRRRPTDCNYLRRAQKILQLEKEADSIGLGLVSSERELCARAELNSETIQREGSRDSQREKERVKVCEKLLLAARAFGLEKGRAANRNRKRLAERCCSNTNKELLAPFSDD